MSDRSDTMHTQPKNAKPQESALRRRMPYYAAIAVLGVLTLAYIDGGEEPIHPIVHRIAAPVTVEGGQ